MADEKIFSAHEHLNAILSAVILTFESSNASADLVVAGVLRAAEARLKYLNDIVNLRGEDTDSEFLCTVLQQRIDELNKEVQDMNKDHDEMSDILIDHDLQILNLEAKIKTYERLYGKLVNNI